MSERLSGEIDGIDAFQGGGATLRRLWAQFAGAPTLCAWLALDHRPNLRVLPIAVAVRVAHFLRFWLLAGSRTLHCVCRARERWGDREKTRVSERGRGGWVQPNGVLRRGGRISLSRERTPRGGGTYAGTENRKRV